MHGSWTLGEADAHSDLDACLYVREEDVERYATTTGPLTPEVLRTGAANSWQWSRELAAEAADRWGVGLPLGLHEEIAEALAPAE
ncbi:hypothetical protein [Streptomyces sp. NPDC026589]|uniref:hypothetical protein n=1 Tax=Streptomyces sp. NPDC026589 TaxID=3155609 RepID=UPI0033E5018C